MQGAFFVLNLLRPIQHISGHIMMVLANVTEGMITTLYCCLTEISHFYDIQPSNFIMAMGQLSFILNYPLYVYM